MTYDSRTDTLFHSLRVAVLMTEMIHEALTRSIRHDLSKTESPEVEVFDLYTPKLKGMEYGSQEYKDCLAAMGPALKHHYENNPHHPEFFDNGINDMTLIDLMEMLADWKAATERVTNGDLAKSLEINKERFSISDQLLTILANTAKYYGWMKDGHE